MLFSKKRVIRYGLGQFYYFKVFDVFAVDGEADKGSDGLLAIESCGSWIDVKEAIEPVIHYLQDVGMA